jgi:hypothetical protein
MVLLFGLGGCGGSGVPSGDGGAPDGAAAAGVACPFGSDCRLANGAAGACCGGSCVDPSSDPVNCGFCGARCPVGMTCAAGTCSYASCTGAIPRLPAPPSPRAIAATTAGCALPTGGGTGACCAGACRATGDFASDNNNCGGCGIVCPVGETCTTGSCHHDGPACGAGAGGPMCAAGLSCFSSSGCLPTSCAGLADGAVCPLASGGLGACCGGACVDANGDRANCGACGHVCPAGTGCAMGACYPLPDCHAHGAAGGPCGLPSGAIGTCCGTRCVDLASDPTSCGSCGIVCRAGATCVAEGRLGECGTSQGGGFSASLCQATSDCPTGSECYTGGAQVGFCARLDCTGIADGQECYLPGSPDAGVCCGGACVDPTRDPNCGGCGVACDSGVCVVLLYPFAPVATCLPAVNPGLGCSTFGGCPTGDACVGGSCLPTSCSSWGGLCAGAAGQPGVCCASAPGGPPACVDIASDGANCGGCNSACAAGLSCRRGHCQ